MTHANRDPRQAAARAERPKLRREIPREDRVLSAIDDANDPLVGSLLAERFRILASIGSGGMGKVYEAEDLLLKRKVAFKVLKPDLSANATASERLLREATAASSIGHDNVITVYHLGYLPSGSAYYVMEILRGESLAHTLQREGRLPWPRVAGIALQLCDALAATHREGIVHRDLKPENIFRSPRPWNPDFIKILDFGIAGIAREGQDPEDRLTRGQDFIGTIPYMSPEQASGDMTAHPRIDVYATGVLIYHLLTGRLPFRGDNAIAVLNAIREAQAPAMRVVAPDAGISPAVEALVARAMHRDLTLRFPDIASLGAAILALCPSTSTAPPLPQPPLPPTKSRPDLTLAHRPTELATPDADAAIAPNKARPSTSTDAPTKLGEDAAKAPIPPAAPTPGPATASQPHIVAITPTAPSPTPVGATNVVLIEQAAPSPTDTAIALQNEAPSASTTPPPPLQNTTQIAAVSAPSADTAQTEGEPGTPSRGQAADRPPRRWWPLGVIVAALVAGLVISWQALSRSEEPIDLAPEERPPVVIRGPIPTPVPPVVVVPPPEPAPKKDAPGTLNDVTTGPVETSDHKIRGKIKALAKSRCAKENQYNTEATVTLDTRGGKTTIKSVAVDLTLGKMASTCLHGLEGNPLNVTLNNGKKTVSTRLSSP